jgi:hypothetical protein
MERIKRQQQKKKTNRRAITDEHSPHWVKKKTVVLRQVVSGERGRGGCGYQPDDGDGGGGGKGGRPVLTGVVGAAGRRENW